MTEVRCPQCEKVQLEIAVPAHLIMRCRNKSRFNREGDDRVACGVWFEWKISGNDIQENRPPTRKVIDRKK